MKDISKIRANIKDHYKDAWFNSIFEKIILISDPSISKDVFDNARINYQLGSLKYNIATLPITIMNKSAIHMDCASLGWFKINLPTEYMRTYKDAHELDKLGFLDTTCLNIIINEYIATRTSIEADINNLIPEYKKDVERLFNLVDQSLQQNKNVYDIDIHSGSLIRDLIILVDKLLTVSILNIPYVKELELHATESVFSRAFLLFIGEMQIIFYMKLAFPEYVLFKGNALFYNSSEQNKSLYEKANYMCRHIIMHGQYPSSYYAYPKNIWKAISFILGIIKLQPMFKASKTIPDTMYDGKELVSINEYEISELFDLYMNTIMSSIKRNK